MGNQIAGCIVRHRHFMGLISNNGYFGNLIRKYEYSKPTARKVSNAKGLSVYYSEAVFAVALVIIDPRGYEQATELSHVPTFYAHRELLNAENYPPFRKKP